MPSILKNITIKIHVKPFFNSYTMLKSCISQSFAKAQLWLVGEIQLALYMPSGKVYENGEVKDQIRCTTDEHEPE